MPRLHVKTDEVQVVGFRTETYTRPTEYWLSEAMIRDYGEVATPERTVIVQTERVRVRGKLFELWGSSSDPTCAEYEKVFQNADRRGQEYFVLPDFVGGQYTEPTPVVFIETPETSEDRPPEL